MISLRGERQCLELNMARDRVLKVNGRVSHMDQDIFLGNQHLEWNWGQQWGHK